MRIRGGLRSDLVVAETGKWSGLGFVTEQCTLSAAGRKAKRDRHYEELTAILLHDLVGQVKLRISTLRCQSCFQPQDAMIPSSAAPGIYQARPSAFSLRKPDLS